MSPASIVPNLSVLFVDDHEDIRLIVEMSLRLDPQIKVHSFASAEMAIDHVQTTSETYDVALLAFILPGMQGTALVQSLRGQPATRSATIIFLTALIPSDGPGTYSAMGADGVILRPFDPLQLSSTIRNLAQPA